MVDIAIDIWQVDYKRVFATRAGHSESVGPVMIEDILRCDGLTDEQMQQPVIDCMH